MPEDRPDVVLGWGYGPTNLTSPALAAAAGALADTTMADQAVTELRIGGVSGSDSSTMLEHPTVLQVAGGAATGFFRRWIPDGPGRLSVPWKLEAYSWGGGAVSRVATWLLLAPFMMYNVAYFMLPPGAPDDMPVAREPVPHVRPGRGHRMADALLRLLALAATVQFVSSVTTVTVSTVALQAASRDGMLPDWMGWYEQSTAGWRVAAALISVGAVVAGLWVISKRTALQYESRTSSSSMELHPRWPLTQPGFWKGGALAGRQRALHCAAALAAPALIVMLPAGHQGWEWARWLVLIVAVAMLVAAAASVAFPMAERHQVTLANDGRPPGRMADRWCAAVVVVAALTLYAAGALFATDRTGPRTDPGLPPQYYVALPGLDTFLAGLLVVQVVLLLALAVTVVGQAGRARAAGCYRQVPPFLRGWLAPLVALLGVILGWILATLINLSVARLLGTPVPTGYSLDAFAGQRDLLSKALAVPWPIYFFGVALILGLIVGAIIAAYPLYLPYFNRRRHFQARVDDAPSPVAAYYRDRTAGAAGAIAGDAPGYARNRYTIARAWAVGRLTDQAGTAAACVIGAAAVVALSFLPFAAAIAVPPGSPKVYGGNWWPWLAAGVAALFVFVVLRRNQLGSALLKNIRAVWDMVTFWPRAVHPLAPPSYAGRAVPEIVDRIRLLTGHIGAGPYDEPRLQAEARLPGWERTGRETVPAGPVLLSGYGHGSAVASAVIAQLPPEVRGDVGLLTLSCPVRRLYGRAFPAYFGGEQLAVLAEMLDAGGRAGADGRWKNLCRRSDYLGSWVFQDPEPCSDPAYLAGHVDQACWDPVVLVPDANPAPPPTRGHAGYWSDRRTSELGAYLVDLLEHRARAGADGTVGLSEDQQDGAARGAGLSGAGQRDRLARPGGADGAAQTGPTSRPAPN